MTKKEKCNEIIKSFDKSLMFDYKFDAEIKKPDTLFVKMGNDSDIKHINIVYNEKTYAEKDLEVLDLIVRYEINVWCMKYYDYEYYVRVVDYRLPKKVFEKVKKGIKELEK